MLAYNLLITLKLLDLPEDAQTWRIRTTIRYLPDRAGQCEHACPV